MDIIRYLAPGEASWKDLLDTWILQGKNGKTIYPEGRRIVAHNLSTREKAAILARIPKPAQYIKDCLRAFWKLNLKPKPNSLAGLASESPWHSHRFQPTGVPNHVRSYCKHVLQITQFSDFIDRNTEMPFTRLDWRNFVDKLETKKNGVAPTGADIITKGDAIYDIQMQIPPHFWAEIGATEAVDPKKGAEVSARREGHLPY